MVNCRDCRKDATCLKPFESEARIQIQYLGSVYKDEEDWFKNGTCVYFELNKNSEQERQSQRRNHNKHH